MSAITKRGTGFRGTNPSLSRKRNALTRRLINATAMRQQTSGRNAAILDAAIRDLKAKLSETK